MASIDIDFDVFKALTARRQSESITFNDVLRELLGLGQSRDNDPVNESGMWEYKGVRFAAGTEFRALYKGSAHYAKVENGRLMLDGKPMNSPSEAAHTVTGNSVNGWKFWECRTPGSSKWRSIEALR